MDRVLNVVAKNENLYLQSEENDKNLEPNPTPIHLPFELEAEPYVSVPIFREYRIMKRLFEPLIMFPDSLINLLSSDEDIVAKKWNPYKKKSFLEIKKIMCYSPGKYDPSIDFHLKFLNELFEKFEFNDGLPLSVNQLSNMMTDIEIDSCMNMNGDTGFNSHYRTDISNDTEKWFYLCEFFKGVNIRISSAISKISKGYISINGSLDKDYDEIFPRPKIYDDHGISSELFQHLEGCLTLKLHSPIEATIVWNNHIMMINYGGSFHVDYVNRLDHIISMVETNFALSYMKDCIPNLGDVTDYIMNLTFDFDFEYKNRCSFSANIESLSLQLIDCDTTSSRSSTLPLIDTINNLVEAEGVIGDSIHNKLLNSIRTKSLIEMFLKKTNKELSYISALHKNSLYAISTIDPGLTKYTNRTNRDWNMDVNYDEKLQFMFRKKFIFGYINKYSKLPSFQSVGTVGSLLADELDRILTFGNQAMALSKDYNNFAFIELSPVLFLNFQINAESRLIDKGCTKSKFSNKGNSIREIDEFLYREDPTPSHDLFENIRQFEEKIRLLSITKDDIEHEENLLVRLYPKEREQKSDFRFFGIASYDLKLLLSSYMEICKKACAFIDGQMLTKTKSQRDQELHDLAQSLRSPNHFSMMADISGHNQCERPHNMIPILNEIGKLFGMDDLGKIAYIFNNISVIYENDDTDFRFYSKNQLGAIEGWMNPLWCLQSALIMSIFNEDKGYIVTRELSYSDDMVQDIVLNPNDDTNAVLMEIKEEFIKFGFLVKFSQTTISDKRVTLLKKTYIMGEEMSTEYKRLLAMSYFSGDLIFNDLIEVDSLNSSYASILDNSHDNEMITNFRWLKLIPMTLEKFGAFIYFHQHFFQLDEFNKMFEAVNNLYKSGISRKEREIIYHLLLENLIMTPKLRFLFYAYCTMPTSIQGLGVIPYIMASISGYSDSFLKRVDYLLAVGKLIDKKTTNQWSRYVMSCINFPDNFTSLLSSPFPIISQRTHPSQFLSQQIKKSLKKKRSRIKNKLLLEALEFDDNKDQIHLIEMAILGTLKNNFSFRIGQKYSDCLFNKYIDYIIKKVDSSSTLLKFVPDRINFISQLSMIGNKITRIEDKKTFGFSNISQLLNLKYRHYESDQFRICRIEELPFFNAFKKVAEGRIHVVKLKKYIQKDKEQRTELRSYRTTNGIKPKFRSSGIEWYFTNWMHYKMFETSRYTAWLIADQEQYGNYERELSHLADLILSEYTQLRYVDLKKHISLPVGGQILHRTDNSGFKNSSYIRTLMQEAAEIFPTGLNRVFSMIGTKEHNCNIELAQSILIFKKMISERSGCKDTMILDIEPDFKKMIMDARTDLKIVKSNVTINDISKYTELSTDFLSNLQIFHHASLYLRNSPGIDDLPIMLNNEQDILSSEFESVCEAVSRYIDGNNYSSIYDIDEEFLDRILLSFSSKFKVHQFRKQYESHYFLRDKFHNMNRSCAIRHLMSKNYFEKRRSGDEKTAFKIFLVNSTIAIDIKQSMMGSNKFDVLINLDASWSNYQRLFHNYSEIGSVRYYNCEFVAKVLPEISLNSFFKFKIIDIINEISYESSGEYMIDQMTILPLIDPDYVPLTNLTYLHDSVRINYTSYLMDTKDRHQLYNFRHFIDKFESLCAMKCSILSYESLCGSNVFHSAVGLLRDYKNYKIIDLTAGRGDFHQAMEILNIEHTSIQLEDSYTIGFNMPGMIRKKQFNAFDFQDLQEYLDHEVFLYDISYAKNYEEVSTTILSLLNEDKVVIMRLNQFPLEQIRFSSDVWENKTFKLLCPTSIIHNGGYFYLEIKNSTVVGGFSIETIQNKLINVVRQIAVIPDDIKDIKPYCDSSHEEMSDKTIESFLNSDDNSTYKKSISKTYLNLGRDCMEFISKNAIIVTEDLIGEFASINMHHETTSARILVQDEMRYAEEPDRFIYISKDAEKRLKINLQAVALNSGKDIITDDANLPTYPFLSTFRILNSNQIALLMDIIERTNMPMWKKKNWLFFLDRILQSNIHFNQPYDLFELYDNVKHSEILNSILQDKKTAERFSMEAKFVASCMLNNRPIVSTYLTNTQKLDTNFQRLLKNEKKTILRLRQLGKRINLSKLTDDRKEYLQNFNLIDIVNNPDESLIKKKVLSKVSNFIQYEDPPEDMDVKDIIKLIQKSNPWISALIGAMVTDENPKKEIETSELVPVTDFSLKTNDYSKFDEDDDELDDFLMGGDY